MSIRSLRTTSTPEDKWLENHNKTHGAGVENHPNYHCLIGNDTYLQEWFASMKNPNWKAHKQSLFDLLEDIKENGIQHHVRIYRDGRINTGHKRLCIGYLLGIDTVRAEVVPDDFKL